MVGVISYEYFTKNVTQLAVIPGGEGLCISISKNHHKALLLSTTEKTFSDPIEYELSTSNRNLVDYVSLSMSSQKDIPKFISHHSFNIHWVSAIGQLYAQITLKHLITKPYSLEEEVDYTDKLS